MFNKWKRRYKELEDKIRYLEDQIPFKIQESESHYSQNDDEFVCYMEGYQEAIGYLTEILAHNQAEDMGVKWTKRA